jgi:putative isomerase
MAYLPLVLGEKLPQEIRLQLVQNLKESGHITQWGLATEQHNSPLYDDDGYWKGPIWAPSTMIIVDGLARCGEEELAQQIAEKFCDLCLENGFAENFNALTGTGLRDKSYIWTASVFFILAHNYLQGNSSHQLSDGEE